MNNQLLLTVHERKSKYAFAGLRDYAETLERLLAEETARVLTRETVLETSARSRDPSVDPEDPSEELIGLRDSFPTILRGSLLPYIHGNFERIARSMANLCLPKPGIAIGTNTNEITKQINIEWPGTIDDKDVKQLADYMHLRNMCAHTAGALGRDLLDPKRVAFAAQRTQGALFKPHAAPETDPSTLTKEQRWSGHVEFDASFLPEAIEFHFAKIEEIAKAVSMAAKT